MQLNNTPQGRHLLPHHHQQLVSSGLAPATMTTAGFYSITDGTEAALALNWKSNGPSPSLAIPYTGLDGSVVQTILRPDQPRNRDDGSIAKYEQPLGEPHRIYFPRTIAKEAFLDATRPIIFTEGVKKCLCVVQAGAVAVSAQGVSVWHDAAHRSDHRGESGEWKLRDDLCPVPLAGRRAYVAFDGGDTTTNPAVILSEARLARMLLDAGADVRLVRVPFTVGGPKVGIDDYLAKQPSPSDALNKLLADALTADPVSRAQDAAGHADAPAAVGALMRDLAFAAAVRVGGLVVSDLVFAGLRRLHISKAAIDEMVGRFAASFAPPSPSMPATKADRDDDVNPAPEPQPTATLLNELVNLFERFAALPAGAAVVLALWVLHTWAFEAALFTPRIGLVSPTKRCGKSTVLDLLAALCRRALMSANVSAAALFRVVESKKPTILIDEADSFLQEREELRGVLNAGYEATGGVIRCVGDAHEPKRFSCFAPVAIATIGSLPSTIADRSIVVHMQRKDADTQVARRDREARQKLEALAPRLARWAQDNTAALTGAKPELPETLSDRQRDICEPLLAIADLAGGAWPQTARKAVVTLFRTGAADAGELRERLLAAVWAMFGAATFITLKEIVKRLVADETGGWDTVSRGQPITTSTLAGWLTPFGIHSTQPSTDNPGRARGYERANLESAVSRYLKVPAPAAERVDVSPQGCARDRTTRDPAAHREHANTPTNTGGVVEGVL